MSDNLHRAIAIVCTALAVALPIVGHGTVLATDQTAQMILTVIAGVLATLGFTAIKPIAPWLVPWATAHKWIGQVGVILATALPAVRLTAGAHSAALALGCDIATAILGSAGFVAIHSVNAIPRSAAALLLALLSAGVPLSGCATGSDGARQAETAASAMLGAGYRATVAYTKAADADAVAKAKAGDDNGAAAEIATTRRIAADLFRVLDTASAGIDAQDAAIQLADAAKKKDYGGIVGALVKIGGDIVQAFADNGIKLALPAGGN